MTRERHERKSILKTFLAMLLTFDNNIYINLALLTIYIMNTKIYIKKK